MTYYNKPAGITINQYMDHIKQETGCKKLCFCGRLDPMARGKVLVLMNDECKLMPQYNEKKKVYNFEIVLNLQTDSDDPLGIIEHINNDNTDTVIEKLKTELNLYKNGVKPFLQKFHDYSSKRVDGQPLWYYKKNNLPVKAQYHTVQLYSLKFGELSKYDYLKWKNVVVSQINTIDKKTDFKQSDITEQWNKLTMDKIISIPVEVNVSSGFYIRQFVRDLSIKIKHPLLTFDINRTSIYD